MNIVINCDRVLDLSPKAIRKFRKECEYFAKHPDPLGAHYIIDGKAYVFPYGYPKGDEV